MGQPTVKSLFMFLNDLRTKDYKYCNAPRHSMIHMFTVPARHKQGFTTGSIRIWCGTDARHCKEEEQEGNLLFVFPFMEMCSSCIQIMQRCSPLWLPAESCWCNKIWKWFFLQKTASDSLNSMIQIQEMFCKSLFALFTQMNTDATCITAFFFFFFPPGSRDC